MSILFALETIINGYISSKNKKLLTITFGAPSVISLERKFNQLSKKSQQILSNLHNSCHCFVNGFDPIARVPSRTEWIMTGCVVSITECLICYVMQICSHTICHAKDN